MTVAVTLIVRDEERTLARCLDSLVSHVDEIVVVDTGSADGTREIARRYTDRVFDFTWIRDFAAARQFALERATTDWVFWLDADDVLHGGEHIRRRAAEAPASTGAIYWRYIVARDEFGNSTTEYWRERLVRNDGSARWVGAIHETLSVSGAFQYDPEVWVEHFPETKPERLARNLAIMEAVRSTDAVDPRTLFYLGRDYHSAGQYEAALDAFTAYTKVAVWLDEKYQAQVKIAELLRLLGRWSEAIDADLAALKIHPHWPDAYFGLAKTYYFLQEWAKTAHWSEVGELFAVPNTLVILNPMDYRYNWIIYYTVALYHLGQIEDALRWSETALAICPGAEWHVHNADLYRRLLEGDQPSTTG